MYISYHKLLHRYTNKLLPLNHVVGVGYGKKIVRNRKTNEDSIVVMVDKKVPVDDLQKKDIIPEKLEHFKTDVQEVGQLKLLKAPRNNRFRPAPGGVSIGHYKITAGTLGAIVKDNKTGEPLILSNNHVLANISNGRDGRAKIGDPILQPGSYDKGTKEKDLIGHLHRFMPLNSSRSIFDPASNIVDCALARPVDKNIIEDNILEIGKIEGVREPELDMLVFKSGRTTGLTKSSIKAIDSTIRVSLDNKRDAVFSDQIITEAFSEGGDSGSLVVDKDRNAVGLLFAGSKQVTICNKISNVMKELDIDFYGNSSDVGNDEDTDTDLNGKKTRNPNIIFLLLILILYSFTLN